MFRERIEAIANLIEEELEGKKRNEKEFLLECLDIKFYLNLASNNLFIYL